MQFDFIMPEMGMQGDLEINVQNERNSGTGRRSSFLGRVLVPISTVPNKPEVVRWYPLQKRGLFSHIKGDLGSVSLYHALIVLHHSCLNCFCLCNVICLMLDNTR